MKGLTFNDVIAISLMLLALVLLTSPNRHEPAPDSPEYCSQWEIWHNDRRAGIPMDQRYGWPDSEGKYYTECKGE